MDKTIEVLVMGRINVDYLNILERYPEEDAKIAINDRIVETGGQGSNTSCCIAKLGGKLEFVSRVGDDDEGLFCLERFRESGVDTGTIEIIKGGRTPVSYIFITKSTGARTIMYDRETLPAFKLDEGIKNLIAKSRVLLLDPSVTYLSKELAKAGSRPPIIYDCERWREGMDEMMEQADFFAPSAEFLSDRTLALKSGTTIDRIIELSKKIPNNLIVTDAASGAYFMQDGALFQVRPPFSEIIDTTGAGDNFHAALALAVSRGFELPEAVKISVAVATISCRGYGGRVAVPSWDEALNAASGLNAEKVC